MVAIRDGGGFAAILDGTNLDDLGDTRPGLRAAGEREVRHPLVEAGLDKAAVRRLARAMGLAAWDKPEMACLASRLPVGTPVTIERLKRAEEAEAGLKALGFRQVRVRDHGRLGRVEIAPEEMDRIQADDPAAPDLLVRIEAAVTRAGFAAASIDPRGYRRGGMAAPPGPGDRGVGHPPPAAASEQGGTRHG
jgi:uncharacterized protein